jgi:hypothetical protein
MKKMALTISCILVVTLAGCQQMQQAANSTITSISKGVQAYDGWIGKGNVKAWGEMRDENIRNKFLVLSSESENNSITLNQVLLNDKYKLEKRTFDAIFLEKYITHQANFSEANRRIDNGMYISEKDLAAKLFIEQALARGNEVRMYKKSVNAAINNNLRQAITNFNGASNRYDADPAFVEFDKNGSPVSIMTRSWQTISAIGVDSRIYTNIYFGKDMMRWFENNYSNRYLENNFIRTYR